MLTSHPGHCLQRRVPIQGKAEDPVSLRNIDKERIRPGNGNDGHFRVRGGSKVKIVAKLRGSARSLNKAIKRL